MSSGQKQLSLKGKDLKLQSLFCGTRACKLRCQGVGSVWITEQRSGQGQVCSGRDMLPRTPQACCLDPSWLLCYMKSSQEKEGRNQDGLLNFVDCLLDEDRWEKSMAPSSLFPLQQGVPEVSLVCLLFLHLGKLKDGAQLRWRSRIIMKPLFHGSWPYPRSSDHVLIPAGVGELLTQGLEARSLFGV